MSPSAKSPKPLNYRTISLVLLTVVFIQATVIIQLYFVSSSCAAQPLISFEDNSPPSLKGSEPVVSSTVTTPENAACGILRNIPIGEENAAPFGLTGVSSSLVYPTAGITLEGGMISGGPVTAIPVRHSPYGNEAVGVDEWIVAAVNMEYIKMLQITIKQNDQGALVVFASAAGYVNVHSLHSFGNSVNVGNIATSDLTSTIVKHAWKRKVDQELHGYQLSTFNYCVCSAISTTLPTSNFDSISIPLPTNDASAVMVTDSHTLLGGSQVTNGPIHCRAFRSSNVDASAQKAIWLIAAINDNYIKMVEITITQAEVAAGTLSVFASNSGYAMYQEFGTHETEALTSRVVNAAWNKMIPNSYEVAAMSYYSNNDDIQYPGDEEALREPSFSSM